MFRQFIKNTGDRLSDRTNSAAQFLKRDGADASARESNADDSARLNSDENTGDRIGDRVLAIENGLTVGKYQLDSLKGIDAFMVRYLGHDIESGDSVLVEEYAPAGLCLRSDDGMTLGPASRRKEKAFRVALERFEVEGQMLTEFDDPGVIECHETILANGTCYRILEDLTSKDVQPYISLRALIQRDSTCFSEALARDVLLWILPVLSDVHKTNALHRAITPDNILIGEDGRIVLTGFGAARYMIAEKAETLSTVLEPGYAPFEFMQRRDHQGPCSDLYSLGASLYFAMTGRDPVDAPARFDAVQNRDPDPLKSLTHMGAGIEERFSHDIRACVDWMLSLRVQDRPSTGEEVMARLGAFADMPAVLVSIREGSDTVATPAMAPESQSVAAVTAREKLALGQRRVTTAAIAAGILVLTVTAVIMKPGGWTAIGTKPEVGSAAPAVGAAVASTAPLTAITQPGENRELIKSALAVQSSESVAANLNEARMAMLDNRLMETSEPSALGLLEKALKEQPDNALAMEGINHLLHHFVNELQRAESTSDGVGIRVINRNLRRIRLRHPESQPVLSPGFYSPIKPGRGTDAVAGQVGPGQRDFVN